MKAILVFLCLFAVGFGLSEVVRRSIEHPIASQLNALEASIDRLSDAIDQLELRLKQPALQEVPAIQMPYALPYGSPTLPDYWLNKMKNSGNVTNWGNDPMPIFSK